MSPRPAPVCAPGGPPSWDAGQRYLEFGAGHEERVAAFSDQDIDRPAGADGLLIDDHGHLHPSAGLHRFSGPASPPGPSTPQEVPA